MPIHIKSSSPAELIVFGHQDLAYFHYHASRWIPGAQFSQEYKERTWDGRHHPGKWFQPGRAGTEERIWCVRRGFLARILRAFPHATGGVAQPPALPLRLPDTLRDYQRDALQAIATYHWGRIALATNAGKGLIIAHAAEAAAQIGMRVLITVDEVEPFNALREELSTWMLCDVGFVEAGAREIPPQSVVFAMLPTLFERISAPRSADGSRMRPTPENQRWREWLAQFHMILADEADKATALKWRRLLDRMPNTLWRVGFSGTFPPPETVEDDQLEEFFGPVIARVRNADLIGRGISARPRIFLCPFTPQIPTFNRSRLTGPAARRRIYESGIIYNEKRHIYIASLLPRNVPCAIIVSKVAHGNELAKHIPECLFLHGKATKAQRDAALEGFGTAYRNLIATSILDRGSNRLGRAGAIIFASGEGSWRQILQRLGRALRRADGKTDVFLFDVIDLGDEYLEQAVRQRVRIYESEGFDVQILDEALIGALFGAA